jgi:hypothetical protein
MRAHLQRAIRPGARRSGSVPDLAMQDALRAASRAWGSVTDWSLHPLALSSLPELVRDVSLLVVECGSGFSTLVLHEWARRRGAPTRILSFEHQTEQIARLRQILDPESQACVRHSALSQVTEAVFRKMLAAPGDAPALWRDRADSLPEDLYQQTRIARAFYDRLIDDPPCLQPGEGLLVVLDGPNGSGRSIAFPLLAPMSGEESFWLIDDWDHYSFLPEMAAVFEILEERTESAGANRWKLVRARPRSSGGRL